MDADRVKAKYLLHWCVWMDDHSELQKALDTKEDDIEKRDPRGRTPLLLAVTLNRLECTRLLLKHNANVNAENKDGFSVFHEAVSTGNHELVQEILQRRDYQKNSCRMGKVQEILEKIKNKPDFCVEIKWEIKSWVPIVSRYLPGDTYKIYKSGSSVRIDTIQGGRSYIYKGQDDSAAMMEIDHTNRRVYTEQMKVDKMRDFRPITKSVSSHLKTPIVITLANTKNIRGHLERKSNGELFTENIIELVTKKRTEHLTSADKIRHESTWNPFQSFLGFKGEEEIYWPVINGEYNSDNPYNNICLEDYFDPESDLMGSDIGRPKEMKTRIQIFEERLWLRENYPLSFPEQIEPIIALLGISNTEFAILEDFIRLPSSAGFPVKIEIPLRSTAKLHITFEDISTYAMYNIGNKTSMYFEVPPGYARQDTGGDVRINKNDKLFQDALRQLLWEAAREEEKMTKQESFAAQKPGGKANVYGGLHKAQEKILPSTPPPMDDEAREEERQLKEEHEILAIALRLALAERSRKC